MMKTIKKTISILTVTAIFSLVFPRFASAAEPLINAASACLVDVETGRLLYEKDAESERPIASITKIMTALVVLENSEPDELVTVPAEAVGIEGSSIYLERGERISVGDLLYGMMLKSGNDAAVALALHCAGSVEEFARLMNEKAGELGMLDSRFANPNGLDEEGHYSTAKDMALLGAEAIKNEVLAEIVSKKSARIGGRYLSNHNKLLFCYKGANGIKTGFTKASGRTLVSSAEREGRTLVAVTLNAPDDWNDHIKLLEYGFNEYTQLFTVEKGQILGSADIISGEAAFVDFAAASDFSLCHKAEENVELIVYAPGFLYAPVYEGEEIGRAVLKANGEILGSVPLVCAAYVGEERAGFRRFWGE